MCSFSKQGEILRACSDVWQRCGASPRLNFNAGFFIFLSKAPARIIFSVLFRVSNHQIQFSCQIVGKENLTELLFKLSYLSSNFALTQGYLNPALNNPPWWLACVETGSRQGGREKGRGSGERERAFLPPPSPSPFCTCHAGYPWPS